MKYLKVWTSFRDVMDPLSDAEKGRLFVMMLCYADSGEEPADFAGNERFVWPAAKQWIDLTYSENAKQRENGKKGGRPKTHENPEKPNETQENPNEPNKTLKVKESKVNDSSSKNIVPLKRFIPPTVEEIKAYCDERGSYFIDPQYFVDYYEARGWMLKKNQKMVDWKATVRTWEKNKRERQREQQQDNYDLPL